MQETVGHWKLQPGFLFLARLCLVLYTIIIYIIFQLSVVTPSETIYAGSVTRNVSLFKQSFTPDSRNDKLRFHPDGDKSSPLGGGGGTNLSVHILVGPLVSRFS